MLVPPCPGLRAVAQDVGNAKPTSSPLEGNPHLQPPLQHPDRISVLSGGGMLSVPFAGVVLFSTGSHFPQALYIAWRQTEDVLGVKRLPCLVGHPTPTIWSERGRWVSHSSASCPDHRTLLKGLNGSEIPAEMSSAEQEQCAPRLIGTMLLANKLSARREILL